jgi:acetolactate synthase small subunit
MSHGVGRGAFALIFIGGSFPVLPIAHEALSRRVMTLVVRVESLEKVVAVVKELVSSPQVIESGEININLGAIVLVGVDT